MRFRPSNVARSHRANHWSSSSTCAIADRFAACKLVLHPQKTKIVYCKDVNRHGDFPDIHFDFIGFQFRARKTMWVKADRRISAHSLQPAASPKALTRISRDIRLGAGPFLESVCSSAAQVRATCRTPTSDVVDQAGDHPLDRRVIGFNP
jgi:hypothetical protein